MRNVKKNRQMDLTGGHIWKNLLQWYRNDMRQLSTLHTLPTFMHELLSFPHFFITHCALRYSALTNARHMTTVCRDKSYAIIIDVQLREWISGTLVPAMYEVH